MYAERPVNKAHLEFCSSPEWARRRGSWPAPGTPLGLVKLADVAHRTEHDAVRLGVSAAGIGDAIAGLRAIAASDGLSPAIVIQPMIDSRGEALLGVQGESELGPMVVFGLGGVFTEALGEVGGRMAPFGPQQARSLIEEFRDLKVMHGFRGRPAWDLAALTRILVAAGRLAAAGREWIASLDGQPAALRPRWLPGRRRAAAAFPA